MAENIALQMCLLKLKSKSSAACGTRLDEAGLMFSLSHMCPRIETPVTLEEAASPMVRTGNNGYLRLFYPA